MGFPRLVEVHAVHCSLLAAASGEITFRVAEGERDFALALVAHGAACMEYYLGVLHSPDARGKARVPHSSDAEEPSHDVLVHAGIPYYGTD